MTFLRKYPWLRAALRPARGRMREILLASLFINLLVLAPPVFVLQVYDRVVYHGGLTTLQGLVIGMLIVITFDMVLRQTRGGIFRTLAVRVDAVVGRSLFDKLLALPLRTLEARPSAFWQSLFNDLALVRNGVSGPNAALVVDLPFALLFYGFVWVIAAPIAWIMLIIIPLFLLLAWRSGEVMRNMSGEERAAMLRRDSFVHELTAARTTVKALAMDAAARAQWIERHAGTVERSLDRGRQGEFHHNLGHALALLTTVAMTSFGALAILDGQITIGALIASNLLASRIVGPFQQLVRSWRDFMQARQAAARLDRVFAEVEERNESSVGMPRPQGRLRLENLAYRYDPDGAEVVDHLHLQVGPGGLHAIVGPNGSGKSTLLKLIRGLYQPREGRVLLDGADIAQFTRIELGGWIGYLAQDTVLFAGSIQHNITMADPSADDARIIQAARRAGVHDLVVDLPQGYATDIGEAGQRLSAGVRQRIALARALVTDPPVLLLDEPSSNLDIDAEARLAETLAKLAEDHTILVVTHSPTLLEACATIAVMDHGRIRMGGPAAQVLPQLRGGRAATAEGGATPISVARKGS